MAGVSPTIVPFNDTPKLDEYRLSSGYPGIPLLEKSAQAFDKAASVCMVRRHALLLAATRALHCTYGINSKVVMLCAPH